MEPQATSADQPSEPEPLDSKVYTVMFHGDSFLFYYHSVLYYQQILAASIKTLEADKDIAIILDPEETTALPVYQEAARAQRACPWFEELIKGQANPHEVYGVSLSHGLVRYMKAAARLYISKLRDIRNRIVSQPEAALCVMQTLDTKISSLEEKTRMGVFEKATPTPLLISEVILPVKQPVTTAAPPASPLPVVWTSVEVLDPELRSRCLDLYQDFKEKVYQIDSI